MSCQHERVIESDNGRTSHGACGVASDLYVDENADVTGRRSMRLCLMHASWLCRAGSL